MRTRCLLIAAMIVNGVMATGLLAQEKEPFMSAVRERWTGVRQLVVASADRMPEADFAFRPTPDVRTFGQIIGHLIDEHYLICSTVKGEKNPHAGGAEKIASKAELTKALAASSAYCDAAYAIADASALESVEFFGQKGTRVGALLLNVTHDSEHYGNLVTYLRLKAQVPPSTQPTK